MLRCVLFIPSGSGSRQWLAICAAYCETNHYEIIAIAAIWDDAIAILAAGEASVAVVGRRDHLPPDRTPRIEVVTEQPTDDPQPMRRRPHRRESAAG